jgi:hypothetical protein
MLQNVVHIVITVTTVPVFQVGLNCVKQLTLTAYFFVKLEA